MTADLLAMCEAQDKLPSGWNGIGSKQSRTAIYNKMWISFYKDTGLDYESKKPPKGQNLAWVQDEIRKEAAKKKELSDLVKLTMR